MTVSELKRELEKLCGDGLGLCRVVITVLPEDEGEREVLAAAPSVYNKDQPVLLIT